MKLDKVYVIHVKKFVDRYSFMVKQLLSFGIDAEFILDGDIEDLTDEIQKLYFADNTLSLAQKSCAYKHVLTLQKISSSNHQFNLVLEDDALFCKNFYKGIELALDQSKSFPGSKVIFIGSGGNFYTPKSQRKPGQHLYIGHRGRFADSYIIDPITAKKRLDWVTENKISYPIDNQFDLIDRDLRIQILWLEDPVVEQGSKKGLFKSKIEPAPPNCVQRLKFFFEKLKRKYIYQLWR